MKYDNYLRMKAPKVPIYDGIDWFATSYFFIAGILGSWFLWKFVY